MKRILTLLLFITAVLGVHAQTAAAPLTEAEVETAFQQKMQLIGSQFCDTAGLHATAEETRALHFLYAYMPVADCTDYPTRFFLDNIRVTEQARQEMAWGRNVPELLYRHFVLPLRVNNENLDSARTVFYRMLKERVRGLSMKDAILEVNHWCHEHVTYAPSDARTLSPLSCMRNALGRCGEESTFTVAALRAVGIPARQVYTPRWAHTDDNHAWVEAWADGQWWFMGACEPEPVLDLGWFNAPASRALLMHTRAFGDYRGPEEVMLRTSNYTEINLIDNYGSSARVDFTVTDPEGRPVPDARVEFKIYNYAEFYTAVNKYTDAEGKTFLSAGRGDMVVWASKDGRYGFRRCSFGKDRQLTIVLDHDAATDRAALVGDVHDIDIVPPAEHALLPTVTAEQEAENKRRTAIEDSIRKAYEANSFYHGEAESLFGKYLAKARGNWRTINAFYQYHHDYPGRVLALLATLSDKDLRDMPMDILEDNFAAHSDQLCPRVEDEMIIAPFKQYFESAFAEQAAAFRDDPSLLVAWVRDSIRLNPDRRALRIAQTPVGVYRSRLTDSRSRDIFFVDVARSLGIEARKDVVTSKVQYKKGGQWVDVDFDATAQEAAPQGRLVLTYSPSQYLDNPLYYSHFTISRLDDGHATLLNFDEGQVDMGGGTSWMSTFRDGAALDAGTYLLVSGTRLASGSVMATWRLFTIEAGQTTRVPLVMRSSDTAVSVIGSFSSESRFVHDGKAVSLLSQTGRGYYVLGIIAPGQEPTNHALRDISKMRAELDQWGRPLVLLFSSEAEARRFQASDYGQLPDRTLFGIDKDGAIRRQVVSNMKLAPNGPNPVFIIADTFDRVVFARQGYTIGLGEEILKTVKGL